MEHIPGLDRDLKIGDIVCGLLFHTGVVVEDADTNEPLVEWWGYGHGISKMPRRQITVKDENASSDSLHWFKAAVKGNVNRWGRGQSPQHEVTKAMYLKSLAPEDDMECQLCHMMAPDCRCPEEKRQWV